MVCVACGSNNTMSASLPTAVVPLRGNSPNSFAACHAHAAHDIELEEIQPIFVRDFGERFGVRGPHTPAPLRRRHRRPILTVRGEYAVISPAEALIRDHRIFPTPNSGIARQPFRSPTLRFRSFELRFFNVICSTS